MKAAYFNHHEFLKALNIRTINLDLSLVRFKEYLNKYPYDYVATSYYISTLITAKRIIEAEEILFELEKNTHNNQSFQNHASNNSKVKASLLFCKVKLYLYQNDFKKCYDILMDNYHLLLNNDIHCEATAMYCKKKLGYISSDFTVKENEYLRGQIIDYSEEKFLVHIKKHFPKSETNEDVKAIFNEDFPINKVFPEIKKNLNTNLRLYTGLLEDTYIYKYDFCGKDKNKVTDYFKITAIHDTNDFITMCPCIEGEYLDHYDLNYLKVEDNNKNNISQIDKFNKKYAKYLIKN